MRAGAPNSKAKDIPFPQALQDPDTRAEYIRRRFYPFQTDPLDTEVHHRYASVAMVDRRIRPCDHVLFVEDALWDAIHGSGDAECREGIVLLILQSVERSLSPCCRPSFPTPLRKRAQLASQGWFTIDTLTLLSCE